LIISEEEKKTTAYHEIGHVLVARMIPEADPVHKVTIIPRGRALGVTSYLPIDEKHTYSKIYLEAIITYALGGRAAEKIVFNHLQPVPEMILKKQQVLHVKWFVNGV
jgi:cell division protease FtsH